MSPEIFLKDKVWALTFLSLKIFAFYLLLCSIDKMLIGQLHMLIKGYTVSFSFVSYRFVYHELNVLYSILDKALPLFVLYDKYSTQRLVLR